MFTALLLQLVLVSATFIKNVSTASADCNDSSLRQEMKEMQRQFTALLQHQEEEISRLNEKVENLVKGELANVLLYYNL